MAGGVIEERRDRVVIGVLNRPEKLNAFDVAQYDAMSDLLDRALDDDRVGALVVTGAGRAFSAGADSSLVSGDAGREVMEQAARAFDRFLEALGGFEKPLLAAVNGLAVGIGATLLLHCDVVFAARSARLRFPFTSLGLVPEAGSTHLLPLIVGPQRAAEWFFSSDWLPADVLLEAGLVRRVVEDAELVDATVVRAAELAAHETSSLRATKRILLDARRDAVIEARRREDEGMRAQARRHRGT